MQEDIESYYTTCFDWLPRLIGNAAREADHMKEVGKITCHFFSFLKEKKKLIKAVGKILQRQRDVLFPFLGNNHHAARLAASLVQTSQLPGKDRKRHVDKAFTCPLLRGRLQKSQRITNKSRFMKLGQSSGQNCYAGQDTSVMKNQHVLISLYSFNEDSVHHEIRIKFFFTFPSGTKHRHSTFDPISHFYPSISHNFNSTMSVY